MAMSQPRKFIESAPSVASALHRALLIYDTAPLFGGITENADKTILTITAGDVLVRAGRLACTLSALVPPSSFAAICMHNSPEWLVADFACAFSDVVAVGFMPHWPPAEMAFITAETNIAVAFCDLAALPTFVRLTHLQPSLHALVVCGATAIGIRATLDAARLEVPAHVQLVLVDAACSDGLHGQHGHACQTHSAVPFGHASGCATRPPNSLFTVIYSSGTTGKPKGIAISQQRWKNDQLRGVGGSIKPAVSIAHQMLAHGCDRGICWQAALSGGLVVFTGSSHADVLAALPVVRPTYLMAMSHFWTRLHSDFRADLGRALVQLLGSHEAGLANPAAVLTQCELSPAGRKAVAAAAKVVIESLHKALGGRLQLAITGGSHTSDTVLAWMRACLPSELHATMVRDAYGATEFPGISVDGVVSPDIVLKLVDVPSLGYTSADKPHPRGEIAVRNKLGITSSYFNRPLETADAFQDDWYFTGDIGKLDRAGILHIIDRRKCVIELYVDGRSVWAPISELQALYDGVDGVERVFLFGDRNEPSLLACVVPTLAVMRAWAGRYHATVDAAQAPSVVCQDSAFYDHVLAALRAAALGAGRLPHEYPAAIVLEPELWSSECGLVTATGKLRRDALAARYKSQFDELYVACSKPAASAAPATLVPSLATSDDVISWVSERLATRQLAEDTRPGNRASIIQQNHHMGDFIDFQFAIPDGMIPPALGFELQAALEGAKSCCRLVRENLAAWKAEKEARDNAALGKFDRVCVEATVAVSEAGAQYSEQLQFADAFWTACFDRQIIVRRAHEEFRQVVAAALRCVALRRLTAAVQIMQMECAALVAAQDALHTATRHVLVDVCRRAGVALPFQIFSHLWAAIPVEIFEGPVTGAGDGGLGNAIGDVLVTCQLCGCIIEGDGVYRSTPRMVSLDTADFTYCEPCFTLLRVLQTRWGEAEMPPSLHLSDFFVRETSLIHWLQDAVKNADATKDTPASIILGACESYGPRLALGVPSCDTKASFPPPLVPSCSVALCAAAGLSLVSHSHFQWVSYAQLGSLVTAVARHLSSLGLAPGALVGISGGNSIEWAVADFACAAAGFVSVGLHTTMTVSAIAHVVTEYSITCLMASRDCVDRAGKAGSPFWTLPALLQSTPSLRHVVLLDAHVTVADAAQSPTVSFASLLDWVAQPLDPKSVVLPDRFNLRGVGAAGITTIFLTSGSTGPPKGVMCTAQSFINDIRDRSFAMPLITASYIPLSHTSDRMKMWEFLGNGGRVGFCTYAATSWLDHEVSKKGELLQDPVDSSCNIEPLLAQLSALSPSGMACPPRIWGGLYVLFQRHVAHGVPANEARRLCRAAFGNRLQFICTGGAPTSPDVLDFVRHCFPTLELHDSCETYTPCCNATNALLCLSATDGATECGAITEDGRPMASKGVEVALLDAPHLGFHNDDTCGPRGEIIVRSPNVSAGYYLDPVATQKVFLPGGWYRTGDLGSVDASAAEGTALVVGGERAVAYKSARFAVLERMASVGSLRSGHVVFPGALAAVLAACPLVHQVFVDVSVCCDAVLGLVVPSAAAAGLAPPEICAVLRDFAASKGRPACEALAGVACLSVPFTEGNGMLNSQLKLVRPQIMATYRSVWTQLEQGLFVDRERNK